MTNPYWHPKAKPHEIDRGTIRLLCFQMYNLVWASVNNAGTGLVLEEGEVEAEKTELEKLHFRMAEPELSKMLLHLAIQVRTFDDIHNNLQSDQVAAYHKHRDAVDGANGRYGGVFEGRDQITDTLRECSNKIIHAIDVRPTYETQDERDDPDARWGMRGDIELEGFHGKDFWKISIYLFGYLEGVLDLIKFGEGVE